MSGSYRWKKSTHAGLCSPGLFLSGTQSRRPSRLKLVEEFAALPIGGPPADRKTDTLVTWLVEFIPRPSYLSSKFHATLGSRSRLVLMVDVFLLGKRKPVEKTTETRMYPNDTEQLQQQKNRLFKRGLAAIGFVKALCAGLLVGFLIVSNSGFGGNGGKHVTLAELQSGKWWDHDTHMIYYRFKPNGIFSGFLVGTLKEEDLGSYTYDGKILTMDYGHVRTSGTVTWQARPNLIVYKSAGEQGFWELAP
jgi:hypothetical protein